MLSNRQNPMFAKRGLNRRVRAELRPRLARWQPVPASIKLHQLSAPRRFNATWAKNAFRQRRAHGYRRQSWRNAPVASFWTPGRGAASDAQFGRWGYSCWQASCRWRARPPLLRSPRCYGGGSYTSFLLLLQRRGALNGLCSTIIQPEFECL